MSLYLNLLANYGHSTPKGDRTIVGSVVKVEDHESLRHKEIISVFALEKWMDTFAVDFVGTRVKTYV